MYGYGASDRQGNDANCEACGDHGKWPACNACGLCHDCKRRYTHALSCSASAEVTGLVQHSVGAAQLQALGAGSPMGYAASGINQSNLPRLKGRSF